MTPTTYTLRPYAEADLPAMLNVICSAFAQYAGRLDPPSSAERKTIEVVRAELAHAQAIVAEQAGEVVGCVFLRRKQQEVYLDRLSVLPGCRGQGIGHALLAAVEAWALAQGASATCLSVRLVLEAQQAYYRQRGYQHASFGTHEGYLLPTYRNMRKPLIPVAAPIEEIHP
ncbi:GNAT family N-acetyltransferase [Chitinimonas naiadis]